MKTIRFFLLWCMVVAVSACTPFYRGFEGSTLVSPARPDVSVSVADMPMLAHGQIAPFLSTDQGYQFPETFVCVSRRCRGPFLCAQQCLGMGPPDVQRASGGAEYGCGLWR